MSRAAITKIAATLTMLSAKRMAAAVSPTSLICRTAINTPAAITRLDSLTELTED